MPPGELEFSVRPPLLELVEGKAEGHALAVGVQRDGAGAVEYLGE